MELLDNIIFLYERGNVIMDIMLVLTLDDIEKYYGDIPEISLYPDKVEDH